MVLNTCPAIAIPVAVAGPSSSGTVQAMPLLLPTLQPSSSQPWHHAQHIVLRTPLQKADGGLHIDAFRWSSQTFRGCWRCSLGCYSLEPHQSQGTAHQTWSQLYLLAQFIPRATAILVDGSSRTCHEADRRRQASCSNAAFSGRSPARPPSEASYASSRERSDRSDRSSSTQNSTAPADLNRRTLFGSIAPVYDEVTLYSLAAYVSVLRRPA